MAVTLKKFSQINDKLLDPRDLRYKLNNKLSKIIKTNLDKTSDSKESKLLKELMDSSESEKSMFTYDQLTIIHKFLERLDPSYNLFFYQFLDETNVIIPQSSSNADYAARIKKLKYLDAKNNYQAMTKGLKISTPGPAIKAEEFKELKKISTTLINSIIVIFCSSFFIYKAVEYALPTPNITIQTLTALIGTIIIALAELYFFVKII